MSRGARSILTSAKRIALMAGLLALASHALLPYLHSLSSNCGANESSCSSDGRAPSHSSDCQVCSAIAHGGARAIDAPSSVAAVSAPQRLEVAALVSLAGAPRVELAAASARAPPASRLSA
jgi:hypothetical protein